MYKVVIADDEALIRDGLTRLLHWDELGLDLVLTAASSEEAYAYFQQHTAEILITDIRMGAMSGLELIEQVRSLYPKVCCIILSGYDDFTYTKQAIRLGIENYILKPVDEIELTETLSNLVARLDRESSSTTLPAEEYEILRQSVLFRWMKGNISLTALRDRAALLNIPLNQPYFCAGHIRVLGHISLEQMRKVSPRLEQAFSTLSPLHFCHSPTQDGGFCFLLAGDLPEYENRIRNELQKASESLSILGIPVFISLGPVVEEPLRLSESYAKAEDLSELSMVMPAGSVVEEDTAEKLHTSSALTPAPQFEDLRKAISDGDTQKTHQYWTQWEAAFGAEKGVSPSDVRNAAADALFRLGIIRTDLPQANAHFWDSHKCFQQLAEAHTVAELRELLESFSVQREHQFLHAQEKINPSVRRVLAVADTQYAKDLTLKGIAETMKINPVYLGQLFKEEIGVLFTAYLNKVRVHRAALLLRDTDETLSSVARSVGYASVGYFNSIFKKIAGVYPREYRHDPSCLPDLAQEKNDKFSTVTHTGGENSDS